MYVNMTLIETFISVFSRSSQNSLLILSVYQLVNNNFNTDYIHENQFSTIEWISYVSNLN